MNGCTEVYVKTPSRLHFGLVELRGDLGRIFGSVGLALSSPNVVVRTSPADALDIVGSESGRVKDMVSRFLSYYGLVGGCHMKVEQSIPIHIGLGSGTQTALAVAKSLSEVFGIDSTVRELTVNMGRSSISCIGTAVFEKGGFVIDAGYKVNEGGKMKIRRKILPPIIFRHQFPSNWFFVVAIPSVGRGLSGEEERKAFERLPEVSEEHAGKMYRVLYGQILPSLIEEDIQTFGNALTQFQVLAGKCFEQIQGGIYSSPAAEACVKSMLRNGAYGAGQSSWGPTTYGLVYGWQEAEKLLIKMRDLMGSTEGGKVFVASANNHGALIRRCKSKLPPKTLIARG